MKFLIPLPLSIAHWYRRRLRETDPRDALLKTEYDEKLWASLPEAPPLVPKSGS